VKPFQIGASHCIGTVMVDLTPEALHNRMKRGDVYSSDKVETLAQEFLSPRQSYRPARAALRQVAEQVDRSLDPTWKAQDIRKNWAVRGTHRGVHLIKFIRTVSDRTCARMARRMDAELYVVHVDRDFGRKKSNQSTLAANLRFAESLGAR